MDDYIVDIVLSIDLPVDVKYDSEKRLKWRLQKAIDLTRQEMLGLIRSYEQNKRLNYERTMESWSVSRLLLSLQKQ